MEKVSPAPRHPSRKADPPPKLTPHLVAPASRRRPFPPHRHAMVSTPKPIPKPKKNERPRVPPAPATFSTRLFLRLAHRGRYPSLPRIFLHVFELLLGVFQSLLLVGDLLLVLRVLFIPVGGIAEPIAGIGVHGCGTNLIFALHHVDLAPQQINLPLLRCQLVGPLLRCSFLGRFVLGRLCGARRGRRPCSRLGFVPGVVVASGLRFAHSRR